MALNGEKNNNKQSTKTIIECSTKKITTNRIISKPIFCAALSVSLWPANICCFCSCFLVFGEHLNHFIAYMCPVQFFFFWFFDEKMSTPFGDLLPLKKVYYDFILTLEFCCWLWGASVSRQSGMFPIRSIRSAHFIWFRRYYTLDCVCFVFDILCFCEWIECTSRRCFCQFNPFCFYLSRISYF